MPAGWWFSRVFPLDHWQSVEICFPSSKESEAQNFNINNFKISNETITEAKVNETVTTTWLSLQCSIKKEIFLKILNHSIHGNQQNYFDFQRI